ncbi:MAG: DM13 domain-containing protein [Candidatus Lokiarchaeota archaeon]|nr:DM13 domain-containing protein [Candidatus Lokiarchaeota archaeon]
MLFEGILVELNSSHWGTGNVQIVQLTNPNLQAQFVDVEIANGPDLYIYLSNKSFFIGLYDTSGDFINLGILPYNSGRFSVEIPTNTDFGDIKSILIWCLQFSVLFSYAILS